MIYSRENSESILDIWAKFDVCFDWHWTARIFSIPQLPD